MHRGLKRVTAPRSLSKVASLSIHHSFIHRKTRWKRSTLSTWWNLRNCLCLSPLNSPTSKRRVVPKRVENPWTFDRGCFVCVRRGSGQAMRDFVTKDEIRPLFFFRSSHHAPNHDREHCAPYARCASPACASALTVLACRAASCERTYFRHTREAAVEWR